MLLVVVGRTKRSSRAAGLMRTSSYPEFCRIRKLLPGKGIELKRSFLAIFFQDDSSLYYGIVVTTERRVFEFDFSWQHTKVEEGVFTLWREIIDFSTHCWREKVSLALQVMEEDREFLGDESLWCEMDVALQRWRKKDFDDT